MYVVALILLDLTLAFDTIETNEILPAKLKHYGADLLATNLLKEFFTKRSQFLEWNDTKSRTSISSTKRSPISLKLAWLTRTPYVSEAAEHPPHSLCCGAAAVARHYCPGSACE